MDALKKAFCRYTDIGLLIFDECHHCVKQCARAHCAAPRSATERALPLARGAPVRDPYMQLQAQFYHETAAGDRPRILGLTARAAAPHICPVLRASGRGRRRRRRRWTG